MILAIAFVNIWLAANLLLQTGSTPIWVPLTIILIVILILWWGLTRNKISEEEEEVASEESGVASGESEVIEEPVPDVETTEEVVEEAEPERPAEPDDLKLIEGIGPKISSILAEAGITTFAELADTSVDDLERIVRKEAGIRIANPESWPAQAALAASGDMDGLTELQDKLIAGRHVD